MGAEWRQATYLGHSLSSNSCVLGTPEGLEEARTIYRWPELEIWSVDALADIAVIPWSTWDRP